MRWIFLAATLAFAVFVPSGCSVATAPLLEGHPARPDSPASRASPPSEPLWPNAPVPAPGAPVRYTCPMHAEIVRNAPGSCPICKMDLVPMEETTGSVHEGHVHEGHSHDMPKEGAR